MTLNHVRITVAGGRGTVHVDGHELSGATAELAARARPGEVPNVLLELPMLTGEVDCQDAAVYLSGATRDALVALGWTPPSEREVG